MFWANKAEQLLQELFSAEERVAAVTGGGSGIGLAAAQLFSAIGMDVFILDINETAGKERALQITDRGGKCHFLKADVSSAEGCQEAIDALVTQTHGRLDILFNCAGLSKRDSAMTTNADRELLWNVNVIGTESMCKAAVPFMAANGFGRIINMGSVVGYSHIPFPLGTHYKKSKEHVHQFTLGLALEVGTQGITVNALAPGRVLTDLVLMPGKGWVALAPDPVEAFRNGCSTQRSGTMLEAEEVAFQALTLCSPWQKHVNGTIIDMSDCWGTAGHSAWAVDQMPPAFIPFRRLAQAKTSTKLVS